VQRLRSRWGALELAVGLGLLVGPLVYALTLEPAPSAECLAVNDAPVVVSPPRCERIEPSTIEVAPIEVAPIEVAPAPEPEADRAAFMFVTDAGVVLSSEAEHAWGRGRLFEPEGEVTFRAAKRANPDTLPSKYWSMRGRSFNLYGPDGLVCTARLGELRVVAQYGGWGLGDVLGLEFRDHPELASKQDIREGLWRRDDLQLVAEIESPERCDGALWARDAELPPPTILRRSSLPNPASDARLAMFLASETLAQTERSYRADYAALDEDMRAYFPTWETVVAEYGARVWSWVDAAARPQLVELEFGLAPEPCGEPLSSRMTTLEHVRGDEFVDVPDEVGPDAVFDADLDGQLEFFHTGFNPGNGRISSATLEAYLHVAEDWSCPC
jgi:hypothetical protein